ncbi:MAG: hypothetical protein M3Y55_06010 [Pseudomonadota bacterium]|nr:hypothetical protein [Pseudomonadota bacterium]
MQISHARQPVAAAAVSLIAWGACVAAFLPPFNAQANSVPLTVLLGLAIAVTLVLHLVFVGIAAHRLGHSSGKWVALALVTFPIGSIVGLILLEWFDEERNQAKPKEVV